MQDPASACGHHQVVGVQHGLLASFSLVASFFAVSFRAPHASGNSSRSSTISCKDDAAVGRTATNDSAEFQQSIAMARHAYNIRSMYSYPLSNQKNQKPLKNGLVCHQSQSIVIITWRWRLEVSGLTGTQHVGQRSRCNRWSRRRTR